MVPENDGIEVRAENIDERPAQERSEAPKLPFDLDPPEKDMPTKEEGQTVNPTMARTSRNPASGQDLGPRLKVEETPSESISEKKPSVKKKLDECKKIAAEKQLMKELEKYAPPKKIDAR